MSHEFCKQSKQSKHEAVGSVERKHQPFLVLPCWAARLTWVGQIAVPLSFKWAMADATVGNQHQSPPDSGRNHTHGTVEELKG